MAFCRMHPGFCERRPGFRPHHLCRLRLSASTLNSYRCRTRSSRRRVLSLSTLKFTNLCSQIEALRFHFRMKITDLKDGTLVMNAGPTSAAECVTPGNVVIPIALKVDTRQVAKWLSTKLKYGRQIRQAAQPSGGWLNSRFSRHSSRICKRPAATIPSIPA